MTAMNYYTSRYVDVYLRKNATVSVETEVFPCGGCDDNDIEYVYIEFSILGMISETEILATAREELAKEISGYGLSAEGLVLSLL